MSSSPPREAGSSPAPPPEAAGRVFGERLPLAQAYAELLADTGVAHGLIGPREVPRLWDRHLLNCAVVAEAMPACHARVIDVGSGAGLPGIVLALVRPDLDVHLVEPMQRRVEWLLTCLELLGLANVTVHFDRAEGLAGSLRARYVTGRAVARLSTLLPWCAPLVEVGGRVVALKGSSAANELDEARSRLSRWGLAEPPGGAVLDVGAGVVAEPTVVVVLDKVAEPAGARVLAATGRDRQRTTGR